MYINDHSFYYWQERVMDGSKSESCRSNAMYNNALSLLGWDVYYHNYVFRFVTLA